MAPPHTGYATPDPTIASVKRQVAQLYHEAEQASERYNTVRVELKQTRSQLASLTADVSAQHAQVGDLRDQLGAMVAAQAQSAPGGSTSQLLSSGDPEAFLAGLAAVQAYGSRQTDMLAAFEAQDAELRLREQQLAEQVAAIAAARQELAAQKAVIAEKSQQAKDLLAELRAEAAARAAARAARAARLADAASRDEARPEPAPSPAPQPAPAPAQPAPAPAQPAPAPAPPTVPATGRAQAAIDFALAQVGDAYVYGAAGPDAYDCSGLTMAAWAAAGVTLSHSSSVQASTGVQVPVSAMQPGDLVFYYSPIQHVGLYIGDGQLVHSPNPSRSVEVVPVSSMPITMVRRVG